MTQTPERTTAPLMIIFQEISEISENRDLQLASLAALLDQFGSAQKDKLSKLKASAELALKEFNGIQEALGDAREARLQAERDRDDTMLALASTQSEYQASQDALKRVTAELEDKRGRLAREEAARL